MISWCLNLLHIDELHGDHFFPTILLTPFLLIPSLDLITLSLGEKINPLTIEDRIKSEMPFLNHVMVVGDQREFLTCLLTLEVHFHLHGH